MTLTVLLFWIYFYILTLVFVLHWLSLHWEILVMLLPQFPLTFHQTQMGFPVSLYSFWLFSCWLGSLCDHLRDVPWKNIFKLGASAAAASEFGVWVLVWNDVYIPHCKLQVNPHSFPWLSASCAAAIIYRNPFFVCTNRMNLLNLKEISDRLVIVAKGFLKLPDLHMLIKQINSLLPRN